jgi:hypothetical protein
VARPDRVCSAKTPPARWTEIGFVLPKSLEATGGGDGGPAFALRATAGRHSSRPIGFVLPKSAEPCGGGDGRPGIAAPPGRNPAVEEIERLDGRLAPRQRPPLVAVEPHQARRDVILAESLGHDLRAHPAHPQHVRLRLGDADCGGVAGGARALPGDALGERRDLGRQRRVGEHRQAQPVAQRIAGDGGLAGPRARPGAARRVGAVGGENSFVGACSGRRTGFHPASRAGQAFAGTCACRRAGHAASPDGGSGRGSTEAS